jgi:hypothetical protein
VPISSKFLSDFDLVAGALIMDLLNFDSESQYLSVLAFQLSNPWDAPNFEQVFLIHLREQVLKIDDRQKEQDYTSGGPMEA